MDWTKCTYEDILIIKYGALFVLRKFGVISWEELNELSNEMRWRRGR